MRRLPLLMTLVALVGCAPPPTPTPSPVSPLLLPTRIPATPASTPVDARIYYEAGLARQAAGDLEGALQSFTWAIELEPDFAPAYVARGTVYLAWGWIALALSDADAALTIDPASAPAYALRGEALRLMGRSGQASEAFDQAIALDPALKADTFRPRWLAALAAHDAERLVGLGREYSEAHPGDPFRYYYRGWAFLERGDPRTAVNILVGGIETTPDPPALLWFALGQAYAESGSWQGAVTSLEIARGLVEAGDTSLTLHSERPIADLFGALGRAYLGVGRCADAQTMLEHAIAVGAPPSEYAAALEEARLCQTPAPSVTPYPTTTPSF